jgi:starch synthase
VWFVSFESQRTVSAGGLGDAVANLSEALSSEGKVVTVFLPSHGMHRDRGVRKRLGLKDAEVTLVGSRVGYDGSLHPYSIGVEEGCHSGVKYVLFKGADPTTSRWLDGRRVYGNDEATYQKMSLMARGLRGYAQEQTAAGKRFTPPSVIHMHDWHAIPAGVSAWEAFAERRASSLRPALVFTSHLIGLKRLPWHYMSADWSGLRELEGGHRIWIGGSFRPCSGFKEVWEEMSDGSLERFGSYEADFVTSVSESYLKEDLLGYVGQGVRGKSDFVYNGCDWDYQEMRTAALKRLGLRQSRGDVFPPARSEVRSRFLEDVLAEKAGSGRFNRDGPLVLMTGRIERQKGADVLLGAVPSVLEQIPESRFLLLLMPPDGGEDSYAGEVRKEAERHPDNVRLIEGNSSRTFYQLAYLSSDLYAMPSRWEPFGITALEAMATGNPVVGTSTGGIRETVVDVVKDNAGGTGCLVPPEDSRELAKGMVSFLAAMMISDGARVDPGLIAYESLRAAVEEDPSFGAKIRERCIRRVKERFTWAHAAMRMDACYSKARRFAEARARASH